MEHKFVDLTAKGKPNFKRIAAESIFLLPLAEGQSVDSPPPGALCLYVAANGDLYVKDHKGEQSRILKSGKP